MRPIRSLLICTTTMERHVRSALASGADAVVLDLETTIADTEKSTARAAAVGVLTGRHSPDVFVRINEIDSRHVFDDLLSLQTSNLRGVMLPQAEDGRQIAILDWMLTELERRYSRTRPPVEFFPLVETARGAENLAGMLSASRRIRQVTFGVADYSLDTGMQPSRDESELRLYTFPAGSFIARMRTGGADRYRLARPQRRGGPAAFTGTRQARGLHRQAVHPPQTSRTGKSGLHPLCG